MKKKNWFQTAEECIVKKWPGEIYGRKANYRIVVVFDQKKRIVVVGS